MMKSRLLFLLLGLFPFMALTSCSDDDDDNPFVGKWQLMSMEGLSKDLTTYIVTDCSSENKFITFRPNGRMDFEVKTIYSYDNQYLYYYYPSYHGKSTFEYSFLDNNTLRLKTIKIDTGDINYVVGDPLIGKTQVYKRVE